MLEDKKTSGGLSSNSLGLDLSSIVAEDDLGPGLASKVDFGLLDLVSQLGLDDDSSSGNTLKSDSKL